jgi:hypothetical protein
MVTGWISAAQSLQMLDALLERFSFLKGILPGHLTREKTNQMFSR